MQECASLEDVGLLAHQGLEQAKLIIASLTRERNSLNDDVVELSRQVQVLLHDNEDMRERRHGVPRPDTAARLDRISRYASKVK